jgi:DNA excision repair protein ERCC-1
LVNNVTIILAWSAQEAGRYLELFKTYEHAAPTSIKGHQSTNYVDRLVDFTTAPRSVNKTDAISLVSNFGRIRTAINAQPEDITLIAGWGDKKVKRWCTAVREPFRSERAAKKVLTLDEGANVSTAASRATASRSTISALSGSTRNESPPRMDPGEMEAVHHSVANPNGELVGSNVVAGRKRSAEREISDGVMASSRVPAATHPF